MWSFSDAVRTSWTSLIGVVRCQTTLNRLTDLYNRSFPGAYWSGIPLGDVRHPTSHWADLPGGSLTQKCNFRVPIQPNSLAMSKVGVWTGRNLASILTFIRNPWAGFGGSGTAGRQERKLTTYTCVPCETSTRGQAPWFQFTSRWWLRRVECSSPERESSSWPQTFRPRKAYVSRSQNCSCDISEKSEFTSWTISTIVFHISVRS